MTWSGFYSSLQHTRELRRDVQSRLKASPEPQVETAETVVFKRGCGFVAFPSCFEICWLVQNVKAWHGVPFTGAVCI